MKISKFFFLFSLSIIFYSINLNAMEQPPKAVIKLLEEIPIFQQNHNDEITQLKNNFKLTKDEEINRLTLCLILEKEIEEQGTTEKLDLIIEHYRFFKDFINQISLGNMLYELVRHAATQEKTECAKDLCTKYTRLFESSIFYQKAKLNFESLKELITTSSAESIKILINQGILNFTPNKSKLIQLASTKQLNDIVNSLTYSIKKDHKEMCQHVTIITLSLSLLIFYYLLT